ncbi:hypothetical protein GEMRC1_006947 [Eukaryota sp. GEM-RC1]
MIPSHQTPRLSTLSVSDINEFLHSVEVYQSVTDKPRQIPLRLLLEPAILKSLKLYSPELSSDSSLREFLRGMVTFSSYEEFSRTVSELRMDKTIKEPQERMNDYLRRFVCVQERASPLNLSEKVFMMRFARGVCPKGLSVSLTSRVKDDIFPSLTSLISCITSELVDLERARSWMSAAANPEVISRTQLRSDDIKKRNCYRCHRPGHLAVNCKAKVEEVNHLEMIDDSLRPDFVNPLKKICRRGSVSK